jgi:PAS domain S-box-containing protein
MSKKPTYEELEKRVRELESAEYESKRILDALKQKENTYQNLFRHMLHEVHVWELVFDDHGHIKTWKLVDANPAALKSWNKNLPEVIGKTTDEIFPDSNATELFMPIVEKIYREGKPHTWESYRPDTDQFLHMASVSFGDYFITTGFDITDRKKSEEELRQSKILLESSIESPKDIIILSLDRDYRYLYFNEAHSEIMRYVYGSNPQIGDCIFDHMKGREDICTVKAHYDRALAGEGHFAINKYGEDQFRYSYEVHYSPIYKETNELIGVSVFAQNITHKRKAEEALKASEEKFKTLFDQMPVGCAIYSVEGDGENFVFKDFNKASEKIENIQKEDLLGKSVTEVFPEVKKFGKFKVFQEVWKSGEDKYFPATCYKNDYDDIDDPGTWRESWVYKLSNGDIVSLYDDITERKRAEAAQRESEKKYRRLFENMAQGAFYQGPEGELLDCNHAALEIFGLSREAFLEKNAFDSGWLVIREDGTPFPIEKLPSNKAFITGYPVRDVTVGFFNSHIGEYSWFKVNAIPEFMEGNDKPYQVFVTLHDISDLKKMQKALYESEEKYRHLFHGAQVGLFRTSILDGKLLEINSCYSQIAGFESMEKCKTEFTAGRAWADPENRANMIEKLQREGTVKDYEAEFIRGDGLHIWISFSAVIYPEKGYLEGSIVDITSRKQAEHSLKVNEQRMRQLTEHMADVVWTADLNMNLNYVSPSIEKIIGIPADQYIKIKSEEKFSPSSLLKLKATLAEELEIEKSPNVKKDRTRIIEFEERKADGKFTWFSMHVSFIRDSKGNVIGIQGVSRNINDIKRYEAALIQNEKILQAVNFEAELFLSSFTLRKETINRFLARLGEAAGVSRVSLFEKYDDEFSSQRMRLRYGWTSPGIFTQAENSLFKNWAQKSAVFHGWVKIMEQGEVISGRVSDFTSNEKTALSAHGIQSLVIVPVFVEGLWWGIMGFEECKTEREWTGAEIDALRTSVSILGLAIERKHAQERVLSTLREKEVLLREIHHRVKNNMQVTSSLLKLQARQIEDEGLLKILKESENRIRAMALIHEKLYRSENLASIRFKDYVQDLVRNQFASYSVSQKKVTVDLEIEDIYLEIDFATPCGMIITELVSNALKYAFPGDRKGHIMVSLRLLDNDRYELMVKDDGAGLPKDIDPKDTTSFGLYLLRLLAEKQLKGKMEIFRSNGTQCRIRFEKPEFSE